MMSAPLKLETTKTLLNLANKLDIAKDVDPVLTRFDVNGFMTKIQTHKNNVEAVSSLNEHLSRAIFSKVMLDLHTNLPNLSEDENEGTNEMVDKLIDITKELPEDLLKSIMPKTYWLDKQSLKDILPDKARNLNETAVSAFNTQYNGNVLSLKPHLHLFTPMTLGTAADDFHKKVVLKQNLKLIKKFKTLVGNFDKFKVFDKAHLTDLEALSSVDEDNLSQDVNQHIQNVDKFFSKTVPDMMLTLSQQYILFFENVNRLRNFKNVNRLRKAKK